jgi:hypothetical protein
MDAVFPAQGLQADRSSVRTLLTTRTSRQGIPVKYRLVIFDMDGTLADSFPWFTSVLNTVADKYRFRRVAPHEVETLRGLRPPRTITATILTISAACAA